MEMGTGVFGTVLCNRKFSAKKKLLTVSGFLNRPENAYHKNKFLVLRAKGIQKKPIGEMFS